MKPEKEQIDEMINEGLGAGRIDDEKDKEQLKNPLTEKKNEEEVLEKENSMATNLEDMRKLGKEMENMKTNKTIKKGGLTPDPIQD